MKYAIKSETNKKLIKRFRKKPLKGVKCEMFSYMLVNYIMSSGLTGGFTEVSSFGDTTAEEITSLIKERS